MFYIFNCYKYMIYVFVIDVLRWNDIMDKCVGVGGGGGGGGVVGGIGLAQVWKHKQGPPLGETEKFSHTLVWFTYHEFQSLKKYEKINFNYNSVPELDNDSTREEYIDLSERFHTEGTRMRRSDYTVTFLFCTKTWNVHVQIVTVWLL